jgi:microcystin-dependent protein
VGAGPNNPDYGQNTGMTGGSNTRTISIDQMPSHSHGYQRTTWGGGNVQANNGDNWGWNANNQSTSAVGGGQPIDIRPPYYAVFFIIKL